MWQVSDAYEAYVGRWSRPVADLFLRWLAVPPGRRWLDVGCGTGALTSRIAGAASVAGIDPSVGFLSGAVAAGDAVALPIRDDAVDAVVSGLAINSVKNPERAVAEFKRVAAPGGVVAGYVWDYADGMAMMRHFWDAAIAIDPAAAERDEGRAPIDLRALWDGAALSEVATTSLDVPTVFRDFDDYWRPFLGRQGPAPAYLATLPAAHQDAIRDRLRTELPIAADGSIALTARALAVRGSVH